MESEISLEKLRSGDRQEFALLVDRYSGPVYRAALRMLNDEQDAEDVLQETFLKAMRGISSFEGRSHISTWLYRIAMNEALMMLRKKKGGVVSIDRDQEDEDGTLQPKEIVDFCCMPEQELSNSESRSQIHRAIERLSPALRSVFILRDVEGLSVKETADVLEIGESAVKTRLLRARLKLREDLSAYFANRMQANLPAGGLESAGG